MNKIKICYTLTLIIALTTLCIHSVSEAAFDDDGWDLEYQENFDTDYEASHAQTFGIDNWLIYQLIGGGTVTVAGGYAHLNTPDFFNAALIRSTAILPEEYKIRTKIGYINYDLTNYEQADYDDPNFNDHESYYENGVYFLTLTDNVCVGTECAEDWWHYHRKMVIDVDNHINYGGGSETFHPVYMVYMSPETNADGNLLRTWTGSYWDASAWNWNVAYTYAYDTWYYAELEKLDGYITLRLYDESQNILEETTPVSTSLVNAMDNPVEYLYLGEPHTDDYEGDVRIDEITLLLPESSGINDDINNNVPDEFRLSQNYPNPFNPGTTIEYYLPSKLNVEISIYNLLGQKIETILNKEQAAGKHTIDWDGKHAAAGVYFYLIKTNDQTECKKMVLLK